jgi:hypothetical protein
MSASQLEFSFSAEVGPKSEAEVKREKARLYNLRTKLARKEKARLRYLKNKEVITLRNRSWLLANIDRAARYRKRKYVENKMRVAAASRAWHQSNQAKVKAYREAHRAEMRAYRKAHRLKNPNVALASLVRTRLKILLASAGAIKSAKSEKLTGISWDGLASHIESKFQPGMTWSNRGLHGWHVDHIRPCASFDLTDPEQQRACCHYTNLQPLWARDNWIKSDTWTPQ